MTGIRARFVVSQWRMPFDAADASDEAAIDAALPSSKTADENFRELHDAGTVVRGSRGAADGINRRVRNAARAASMLTTHARKMHRRRHRKGWRVGVRGGVQVQLGAVYGAFVQYSYV